MYRETSFSYYQNNSTNYERNIVPNMAEKFQTLKRRRTLLFVCMPLCMIFFMGGGVLSGVTQNFAFIAFVPIGFFGFAATGIALSFISNKITSVQSVVSLIGEINARDCTYFKDLSLARYVGENKILIIVKKLITTKNIDGYETVGDIAVAKKELYLKPSDLINNSTQGGSDSSKINLTVNRPTKCPNCGSAVTDNSQFCSYCGSKLY